MFPFLGNLGILTKSKFELVKCVTCSLFANLSMRRDLGLFFSRLVSKKNIWGVGLFGVVSVLNISSTVQIKNVYSEEKF